MTSRQRVRKALDHKTDDRIPFDLGSRSSAIEIDTYIELKHYLNINTDSRTFLRAHAEMEDTVINRLGVDTKWLHFFDDSSWSSKGEDRVFTDAWGVDWRRRKGQLYYEIDAHPFAELSHSQILDSKWPPIITDTIVSNIAEAAEHEYRTGSLSLSSDQIGAGIFERAWYLRGLENFIIELMTEPDFTIKYLEKILRYQVEGYDKLLDTISPYIETVWITDDVATQDSLLISPEAYRSVIKPFQKELIRFIQSKGVKVVFHSCGAVRNLIPDFIEIGIRILHPIQLNAAGMDTMELKNEFGKDIVFWGGGCDIEILQFGSKNDVEDEVRRRIDHLAEDGGFVFTPTHCIQPGTPPENIIAMADTLSKYGKY